MAVDVVVVDIVRMVEGALERNLGREVLRGENRASATAKRAMKMAVAFTEEVAVGGCCCAGVCRVSVMKKWNWVFDEKRLNFIYKKRRRC